jgi:prepilin-type N-terminal cleavage/methylation domain-containing protein
MIRRKIGSNRRGLTILELIITITVLGIVTGIGYKAYAGIREESQIRAKQRTAQHINELIQEVRQFDAGLIGSGASFAVNTTSVETLIQSLANGVALPNSVMEVKLSRSVTASSYTLQGSGETLQVVPTAGASVP